MLRSSFDSHDSTVEDDRRLLLGGGSLLLHPFPILPERGEFLTKRNELFDPPPLPFPIFTSRFVHFPSFHRATGGGGKWRSLKRGETLFPPPTYRERAFIVGR